MRSLLLSSALLLAGVMAVASAETPKKTIYLDSVVLETLKNSNPTRYAQVREVMASASEMCKPNAARSWALASPQAPDCSSLVLKTSYPPKRQIAFAIDDIRYVALVTILDAPARLTAEPGKVVPASPPK
jgi:hypothetical protein